MLIDREPEMPSELEAEEAKLPEFQDTTKNVVPEVPDRYRGKSVDDIIKMHQEAEKVIGRQAQEVGEVRKLADELIKQNLSAKSQPVEQKEPEVDFYEDPHKAIQQTVSQHPDVLAARQATMEFKKLQTQQKLAQEHPDFMQIAADPDFHAWVKSSPVRLELYAKADGQFDFDSGNELLSTYKALKGVKTQQVQTEQKEKRQQQMKSAQVDTGGTGEASKRVYRRADLIRLKMTDPARYDMLSDEIMAAYREGRVK
jgi:hypothetical protein